MAKDKTKKIIIKKVKKGGHGGHHGGSWKVAYADFVTAMMAFFLLMWLLSMTPADTKKALSDYFQRFTIFQKGGASLLDAATVSGASTAAPTIVPSDGVPDSLMRVEDTLLETVDEAVQKQLPKELKENVAVEKAEDGAFRIQIVDKEGRPLFASGKAELTPQGREVLRVVTDSLRSFDNRVSVEGHTDSQSYAGDPHRNWDLSLERASAAWREMRRLGFDPGRIEQVSGFAANKPYVESDPTDPRNRRVSLLIHVPPAEKVQPRTAVTKAPFTDILKDVVADQPPVAPGLESQSGPSVRAPVAPPSVNDVLDQRVKATYESSPPAPRK